VLKHGKVGQRDTSEHSWEPGTHRTEGLASAWRLHPHGMPVPCFGRTRLGLGPARMRGNKTKEKKMMSYYLILPNIEMCLISKLVSPPRVGEKRNSTPGPGF